jgi:hypothetical protein
MKEDNLISLHTNGIIQYDSTYTTSRKVKIIDIVIARGLEENEKQVIFWGY